MESILIIDKDGAKRWKLPNGKCHRKDGPAVEYINGTKEWYLWGKLHREDGPAIEWANGIKKWYFKGKLHRENGPAIECSDGTKSWFFAGKCHREDGPAIEWTNGNKRWYIRDKLHREDGPAVELVNEYNFWYIDGYNYTEKVYNFIIRRRRKIAFKYWLKWTDYVMDPNTKRGKRFMNRQYDKILKLYQT